MGCLGLTVAMLACSTVCAYLLTQLLVLDWRDGAVGRIGTGLPRVRCCARPSREVQRALTQRGTLPLRRHGPRRAPLAGAG